MIELGVNIDHVATIRQARRTYEPDPVWAAVEAHLGGADGITVHLREDRRHIQDADVRRLRELTHIKLNLEMAATDEMVAIATTIVPEMAMLVPEGRQEVTTEGGLDIVRDEARLRGVNLALHTHANHVNQITPLVGKASSNLLDIGFRDVRNQGVLLDKVNATAADVLELCLALLDRTAIMPYYFFLCDIIPHAEHWRISLEQAQTIQSGLMGLLPGYATPRVVCDVPYLGKRWVHQATSYDRVRGISCWAPNPPLQEPEAAHRYVYYDPIRTLPPEGRDWWQSQMVRPQPDRSSAPS